MHICLHIFYFRSYFGAVSSFSCAVDHRITVSTVLPRFVFDAILVPLTIFDTWVARYLGWEVEDLVR